MTARLLILLSGVILLVMFSVGIAEDEQLQKYKQIWAAQRPQVESGIIHYKQYSGSNFVLRDHDKVRDLLKQMMERNDYPAIVREMACTLNGTKVPDKPQEYPDLVLYFKNDKLRYDILGGVEIFRDGISIEARPVIVNRPSMQQITIRDKNAPVSRPVEGFRELYPVPSAELADRFVVASSHSDVDQLEAVPDKNKRLWSEYTMIVAKSGDVLEMRSGDPKGTCAEYVFSAFKEFDGMRLPQLIFNGTYNNGQLSLASIITIADATFKVEIDDTLFIQDAKAGDVILDMQNGGRVFRPEHDIEDVTKEVPWRAK